jgi:hypothetical protein
MDFWLYALVSADLGLLYESHYTVDAFRDALLENNVLDLHMAYTNITGSVPDAVAEYIAAHPDTRRVELAGHVSRLRYNHQTIKRRPVHCHQVATLVTRIVDTHVVPSEHRRKTYLQTRRRLLEQDLEPRLASALAFEIHHSGAPAPAGLREVKVQDALPDVYLPNAYLCVSAQGELCVTDSTQGMYTIPTSPALPSQWMVRVSPDANEFILGDELRSVHLVLSEEGDGAIQTPIALPGITSPVCVDNRWIVWGDSVHPRAMEWRDAAVECATEYARKLVVSASDRLRYEGNRVLLGNETLAKLPADQSICCIHGNVGAVDVMTTSRDFWRIDVRANTGSCVGLPAPNPIAAMAPLVGWL